MTTWRKEDTLTMTSGDLTPAPRPGQDMPALRLADVLELLTRDIADLDQRRAELDQRQAEVVAQMAEVARATASEEQVAEAYWRAETVPVSVFAQALGCPVSEVHKVAQGYPYWSWRCGGCGEEVFIRSREEKRQRDRRARESRPPVFAYGVELCPECLRKRQQEEAVQSSSAPLARVALREATPLAPGSERERELRTMPYQEYLRTLEWQERRKAALSRARYRCQVCYRSRELHVHHRTYERRGAELASDLIVLCDECHALYHGKGLLAEPEAAR